MIDTSDVAFFVTGMGRSGSLWLARFLDKTPSDVKVMHEALGQSDASWYGRVYRNPALGPEWAWYRRRQMDTERTGGKKWGEVNSYLRYAVHDLREEFPGVPFIGLVRDGRFTVRSMMRLGLFDRYSPPIHPPTWAETSFLKCCWYWADAYRLLVAWDVPIYRLEDLNDNYSEVEVLSEVLGIEPPPWEQWAQMRHKPANATNPKCERLDWSPKELEAFRRVAGDMQRRFGYPFFLKTLPTDAPPKKVEGEMRVST